MHLIEDTQLTEYTWQSFCKFNAFNLVYMIMMMRCAQLIAHIIDRMVLKQRPSFPEIYMKQLTEYIGRTTSGTEPRGNMKTIGNTDTFDVIMMIRWVTNIPTRSPQLELVSWT